MGAGFCSMMSWWGNRSIEPRLARVVKSLIVERASLARPIAVGTAERCLVQTALQAEITQNGSDRVGLASEAALQVSDLRTFLVLRS